MSTMNSLLLTRPTFRSDDVLAYCHNGRAVCSVESIKEAQQIWNAFRDNTGLGASESPRVTVNEKGSTKIVARISYNGRAWNSKDEEITVVDEVRKGPKPTKARKAKRASKAIVAVDISGQIIPAEQNPSGSISIGAGVKATLPEPFIKEGELYYTDNYEVVCVHCAGMSAKFGGRMLAGPKIEKLGQLDADLGLEEFGMPFATCTCGRTKIHAQKRANVVAVR